MLIKKVVLSIVLLFIFSTPTFAGKEDWEGIYTIQSTQGNTYTANHSSTKIKFLFISAKSFSFTKGTKLNDLVATANGTIAADMDVITFTSELAKWGTITNQEINLGPTSLVQGAV